MKSSGYARIWTIIKARWLELFILLLFALLTAGAIIAPFASIKLASPIYTPTFSAALSIGTSGIAAFIFYFTVNERLEHRKRDVVRDGAQRVYRDAKRNIAWNIIHASQKGGRKDIFANVETVNRILDATGFKSLFSGGKYFHEGFYAFQNQMGYRTPEYDDIIFNLKIIGRAFDRLVDQGDLNSKSRDFFVRFDSLIRRIERSGPGYDESKVLCSLLWEIFSGWNIIDGWVNYDPIEREFEQGK